MTHTCRECEHCRSPSEWRQRREALELPLVDLAREVGSTASQLSLFERGHAGMPIPKLLRLMDVLGFDAGDLPRLWRSRERQRDRELERERDRQLERKRVLERQRERKRVPS